MKKVRVITAEEAALMVNDGDTISTGGFVSCACPEALSTALENELFAMCYATADQKEGMGAFLEKRKEKNFQNK